MKPIFIGSGVAIITPFGKDGKINYGLFSKLIDIQILNDTDAIIVCGTTGEGSTLTTAERLKLFTVAVEKVAGRVPVIAGTGSNSTSFSAAFIREAEKTGIDAHLSVTPYYNKASQNGLIKHYLALAETAEKPIILYNVPSRTGVNIAPETYAALSDHENIVAVKEADTSIVKLQKSISMCGDKLDFYSGNDDMTVASCLVGAKGVISVLSNVLPRFVHNMTMSAVNGDIRRANSMQAEVQMLIDALFIDVNPIPVKYLLGKILSKKLYYRLPLCEPGTEDVKILDKNYIYYKEYISKEFNRL